MELFNISVSRQAELLDFDQLKTENRDTLCDGISYNQNTHEIFRFCIAIVAKLGKSNKRQRQKKKYSNADEMIVQAVFPRENIKILGIYPCDRLSPGLSEEKKTRSIPIAGTLKLKGKVKDEVRNGKYLIYACRTDEVAQWVFLKPYIKQSTSFEMQILCVVPKSLDEDKRFIQCNAVVYDNGRELEGAYRRKIIFP